MAGSAWINQVVTQVIIVGPGGKWLIYDPVLAAGDLVASGVGEATTDGPGNSVLPGVTGYSKAGGHFYAASLGASGIIGTVQFWDAATEAGPWTQDGFIGASASALTVQSNSALILSTGGSAGSVTADLASGFSGGVPVSQLDRSTNAAGNDANPHDITTAWSVPAADGANGAKYILETFVSVNTGQTTIETLTLGVDIDAGTRTALATLGAAFNGGALNTVYAVPVRLILVTDAVSATHPQISLEATLGDESANRLATNSANLSGHTNTATWNTASAHTIALYAQWGGAGGSNQNAQTIWSSFTREGQN